MFKTSENYCIHENALMFELTDDRWQYGKWKRLEFESESMSVLNVIGSQV